ncbi:MAG: phosphoribosylanthranilate isomerase [Saprospiraceae bacterium]|jgi:phosphoribosylanthranilate isomerase
MNRVRIKVCGMTRVEDAILASDLGADAIGIVFYNKSPRGTTLAAGAEIVKSINPLCKSVAVVVDPEVEFIENILEQTRVDMLQFHGTETPAFCEQFGVPYVKALRMADDVDLAEQVQRYNSASGLLLDTYVKGIVGGTGKSFDWQRARGVNDHRLILAGGLTNLTIAEAVTQSGIRSIDLSSALEARPGIKDADKVCSLFAALARIK